MFNLQGSEIIFILLIALVVLGPEKLPGAIRRVTSLYAELRKLSSGFQDEFKSVIDEPMREMKSTADLMKNAADPKRIADEAEREAELEAAAAKKAKQASDTTEAMHAAGAAHLAAAESSPAEIEQEDDAFADPVDRTVATDEANATNDSDATNDGVDAGRSENEPRHSDAVIEPEIDAEGVDSVHGSTALSSGDSDYGPEEKSA